MYDRCIVLYLRVLIQPLSTGDRNNLEQRRRETLKRHEVVRDEPSTLQSVKRRSHRIDTFEFVGPHCHRMLSIRAKRLRRTTIRA
jgi:hypothetical protein